MSATKTPPITIVIVLCLCACLAACGRTSHKSQTSLSSSTTSSSLAESTTSSVTAPSNTLASADQRCHTTDLKALNDGTNSAAGSVYSVIQLQSTSSRTCTLNGYAGMALVDAAGTSISQPVGRGLNGASDAQPAVVSLGPGSSAYFTWKYSDVPNGQASCPTASSIWVTPPDETSHLTLVPVNGSVQLCQAGAISETAITSTPGP